MKRTSRVFLLLCVAAATLAGCRKKDGEHVLHILTTNDVHGAWFDSTYVGGRQVTSLMAVNTYVDSVRNAVGKDNVLLIDAGDCLQGDNAPFYFNYIDTTSTHLYARIAEYMGYDAIVVGNHDIETAHPVYDRIRPQLEKRGIPFLAGNAIKPDGKPYFQEYKVFKKAGLRVLVLGYTNPNMKAWLDESRWTGMQFENLIPFIQHRVDVLKKKTRADVVVVACHSGNGFGDGKVLESQGYDLFQSLKGVDVLVTAHDHRPVAEDREDGMCLLNSGSKANNLGHGIVSVEVKGGKIASKSAHGELIRCDKSRADAKMRKHFRKDFKKVKAFTVREVGSIDPALRTSDAYGGQSFYMDLIHGVMLQETGAQISLAAPLTYNKTIPAGKVIYNDMFTIYPYENTLTVMELKGQEIIDYLELSYDNWIQTWRKGGHALRISERDDERYFQKSWSFDKASYNFDSAGGLDYVVDITKPYGSRVVVYATSDGKEFERDRMYRVALTSYRAAGGGDLLFKGAGLTREELEARTVGQYPEIRNLIYEYFAAEGQVMRASLPPVGRWQFVPAEIAGPAIKADMELLFGGRD